MMPIASCHCGRVRIEVEAVPDSLNACQCSICRRYGVHWGYYAPDQVRLLCEPDALAGYVWGDRTLTLHRCATCGCVTHWQAFDPAERSLGINARLFEPEAIAHVPVRVSPGPE